MDNAEIYCDPRCIFYNEKSYDDYDVMRRSRIALCQTTKPATTIAKIGSDIAGLQYYVTAEVRRKDCIAPDKKKLGESDTKAEV